MSKGVTDPEDFFSDTRMSFGDHIEDLRTHLWRAAKGFGVAVVLSFFIGSTVLDWITAPVKTQLSAFYNRRNEETLKKLGDTTDKKLLIANQRTPFTRHVVWKKQLLAALSPGGEGKAAPELRKPVWPLPGEGPKDERSTLEKVFGLGEKNKPANPDEVILTEDDVFYLDIATVEPLRQLGQMREAMAVVGDLDAMSVLSVQEALMVWIKVCLVSGLVLGSPWIFWQVWSFVAAGLYPHEKRYVHVYLPISLFLFLAGVLVCEFLVIPQAIEALLWFNQWLGFKPDLRLSEWLGFAIFMPVVFGLSFQTPLIMLFVNRLGIMSVDSFRNKRRYFWFGMAVFAAVITPSTDALSMLFLWVPMSLLFELGILLIRFRPTQPQLDVEVPESDELIEV